MPDYRIYVLDHRGRIRSRVDLDCQEDAEAVAVVAGHQNDHGLELWDGRRQVGVYPAKGATAKPRASNAAVVFPPTNSET